ncbi:MAG: hypothetical protein ACREPI_12420 [Candidatus Dormibacterales bacterium]
MAWLLAILIVAAVPTLRLGKRWLSRWHRTRRSNLALLGAVALSLIAVGVAASYSGPAHARRSRRTFSPMAILSTSASTLPGRLSARPPLAPAVSQARAAPLPEHLHLGLATLLSLPSQNLRNQLGNSLDTTSVVGRIWQIEEVLADQPPPRLLEEGTLSFGEFHQYDGQELWLANLEVRILNDTGIVGLAVFAALAILLVVRTARALDSTAVQLLAAFAATLTIAGQATQTLELALPWLTIGLLRAALALAEPQPQRSLNRQHVRQLASRPGNRPDLQPALLGGR